MLYLLSLIGGALFYFGSPSMTHYWPLAIGFIPWLFAVDKKNTTREFFYLYLIMSFACNGVLHFWMPMALTEMWHFPQLISILIWLPVALFSEVTFFLWPLLLRRVFNKRVQDLSLGETLLWSAFWGVLEKGTSLIAPDEIGLGWTHFNKAIQFLDISGVSLASSALFLINICAYKLIIHKQKRYALVFAATISLIFGYGYIVEQRVEKLQKLSTSTINGLIIQPNLTHTIRDEGRTGRKNTVELIMDTQYNLTLKALKDHPKADFVFWPETTYPFYFGSANTIYEEQTESKLKDFVNNQNIDLFFGSYGKEPLENYVHNNVYLLSPHKDPLVFEKTILFPFGEYIPFSRQFPWLTKVFPNAITPIESSRIHAETMTTTTGKTLRVGSSICYEVFFEDVFRELARQGVDFSFNASNESWFYKIGEPQHSVIHIQARAAMNKKAVFKSGNTGHSLVADETGKILKITPLNQEDTIYYELPKINYGPTLYQEYGDWFYRLGLLILIIKLGLLYLRKRKK